MKYPEKDDYNAGTAKRLKEERSAKKVPQAQMAVKMEITLDHYKKMEAGKKNIEMWRLQKLYNDKSCPLDIEYIIFGNRKAEAGRREDDVEKDFYRFVRQHQNREAELAKVLLAYIEKIIGYMQDSK